jgi:hypothetical protein
MLPESVTPMWSFSRNLMRKYPQEERKRALQDLQSTKKREEAAFAELQALEHKKATVG